MSNNTIEILTSIHKSVLQIVNNMSPQNGSDVTKLNRGGANTVSKSDSGPAINVKTDSIGGVVKVLSELSPAIKAVAGLSGRQEKRFKGVIKSVMDAMETLNEKASKIDLKKVNEVVNGLTKTATIMHTMMKNMAMWVPLAPLALMGAILAIPAFLMFGLLFKIINMMGIGQKSVGVMNGMVKALNQMTGVILKMLFVSLIMVGLGYFLMNGETGKLILGGLMVFGIVCAMLMAVMLLTWVASKIVKSFALPALKDMLIVILGMTLTLAVFVGFAMLVEDHWEYVWQGLGLFGITCLALLVVIGLTWLASKLITNKDAMGSLGKMMLFVYAAMGIIIASKYLADFISGNWEGILIGFASTTAVLLAITGVAFLANKLRPRAQKGALAIAILAGVAYAVMGIIFLASKLSEETKGKWGDIAITLAAVVGVLLAFGGIAFAVSFIAPQVLAGAGALAAVSGFVLASIIMAAAIVKFHQFKEESGVDWGDVYTNVFALSGMLAVFGILAGAIGLIAGPVALGSLASVALILFVGATINIATRLIEYNKIKEESGVGWDDIYTDVLALAGVIGGFALLAGAMSLAVIPIGLGLLAMGLTKRFVWGALDIAHSVANLGLKIKELGGGDALVNVVSRDMRRVLGAFTAGNLSIPLSIWDIWDLRAQYNAIGGLVSAFVKVGMDISKLAQVAGVVDEQGRVSPVLKVTDKGKVIYGKPTDIKKTAEVIVATIKTFTTSLTDGMCSVYEMYNAAGVVKILGTMIDPINNFVKMLSGYESMPDGKLGIITVKDDGTVTVGKHVDIVKTAEVISNAVSLFINTLFSDENIKAWSKVLYGEAYSIDTWHGLWKNSVSGGEAANKMVGIFGSVMEPVTSLINLLASFEATPDGKLKKVSISQDGKIVVGPEMDLKQTASIIGTCINYVFTELFNKETTKMLNNVPDITDEAWERINNRIKILQMIVDATGSDKIDYVNAPKNALLIKDVVSTVMTSMNMLSVPLVGGGLFNFNIEKVTKFIDVIDGMQSINGVELKKNTNEVKNFLSTLTTELKKDEATLRKSGDTIVKIKDSIFEFDNVLIVEKDNRKQAIDELKSSITDLMSAFDDGKNDNISNLSSLIRNLNSLSKAKVKENAQELKNAIETVNGSGGGGGGGGTTVSINYTKMKDAIIEAIDYDQIKTAVADAIDSMKMVKPGKNGADVYRFAADPS